MKQDWLEDLLAVIETGSLSGASRKRFLSQPAFTRRIQTIENYVGAELFDRDCKPMQLKATVLDNESKIRQLATALDELTRELGHSAKAEPTLVLGCQHSISTAVVPKLVKGMSAKTDANIRIRSANRDECYAYLLTGEVDIAFMYQTAFDSRVNEGEFINKIEIEADTLIPVVASERVLGDADPGAGSELPIIRYPESVFLGQTFNREIHSQLNDRYQIRCIAETALTPAALQLALAGVGVAWVPRSLACDALERGEGTDLSRVMPAVDLTICALTLKKEQEDLTETVWQWLQSDALTLRPASL